MNKIKRFPSWSVEAKAGLILGFTALTLAGSMTLINNKNNQGTKNSDAPVIVNPSDQPIEVSNNTEIVVNEKIETLVRPYLINATIARHYYDMNDDVETRASSIVLVPGKTNTYMKSVGVDYVYSGKTFSVVAATSGIVSERINDATYGNLICISHESGLKTIYSSLSSFSVTKGQQVKQGDVIGTSGESLYTVELGNSLHFEVIKDNTYVNPEKAYTSIVTKI